MSEWSLILADEAGNALGGVRAVVSFDYVRNTFAQASFPLDLEDYAALGIVSTLRNGLPKLRAYRDGVLVFNGNWCPMEEESADGDVAQADLRAIFRSPFESLTRRFTAHARTFSAIDAGTIAQSLLTTENAVAETGLRNGTTVATQTRDRTYEDKQVAEAIMELAAVDGGFDFSETFVDEGGVLAEFNVVAHQGQDRIDAVFEHGPGTLANVGRVSRRWLMPVNRARVLGENGLFGEKFDAGSVAKYGQHMVVAPTSGVVEQATLDDKAIALLRPDPIEIVEFEPDPVLAPQPWDDYWLGDRVPIRSRIGSLSFEADVRINGIAVVVDEEGNEGSHSLTFENPTAEVS